MVWTRFMDMHSGGGLKEKQQYILIEAPRSEAEVIFYNRFGHNPNRVTCTCCGEDYSISEAASLEQGTAYERGCANAYFRPDGSECPQEEAWVPGKGLKKGYSEGYVERKDESKFAYKKYQTLKKYLASGEVLVIYAKDIKPDEKIGEVPEQGYVWMD